MKPIYLDFVSNPTSYLEDLKLLDWLSFTEAREEYFMAHEPLSYTYGEGVGRRTYSSKPYNELVNSLESMLNKFYGTSYNVCFLNKYNNFKNALDWHSDDSPEMNHEHPIAVISFGSARQIWWKEKTFKGEIPKENRQLLKSGSLFIMPAGFQKDHLHKIPKADNQNVGCRISLTFRNYINVTGK